MYALLYCDAEQGVRIQRPRRDYLTVIVATKKHRRLERFLLAVTELPAKGVWHDPQGVSDDDHAKNTVMQIEFGDDADGLIAKGVVAALGLINNLEINEQILYCRIERLNASSLAG